MLASLFCCQESCKRRRRRKLPEIHVEQKTDEGTDKPGVKTEAHRKLPAKPTEQTSLVSSKRRESYTQAQDQPRLRPGNTSHPLSAPGGVTQHEDLPESEKHSETNIGPSGAPTGSKKNPKLNNNEAKVTSKEKKTLPSTEQIYGNVTTSNQNADKKSSQTKSATFNNVSETKLKSPQASTTQDEDFEDHYNQKINSLVAMMTAGTDLASEIKIQHSNVKPKKGKNIDDDGSYDSQAVAHSHNQDLTANPNLINKKVKELKHDSKYHSSDLDASPSFPVINRETPSRNPEFNLPENFKVNLLRSGSTASDTLSIIMEDSESCSLAESIRSDYHSDSEDTLHDDTLDSLSDDDEIVSGSVVNIFDESNNEAAASSSVTAQPSFEDSSVTSGIGSSEACSYSLASDDLDGTMESYNEINACQTTDANKKSETANTNNLARRSDVNDFKQAENSKEKSQIELKNKEKAHPESELNSITSTGLQGCNEEVEKRPADVDFDPTGTLLELALQGTTDQPGGPGLMEADKQHGHVARQSNKMHSQTDHTKGTNHRESVRDSDSGIPSSRPSRTNTPEQKGPKSKTQANDRASVPAISVTATASNEYKDEEDDDIDDLINHHRPNSMLGSRSSLADSRESIYSVYSDAGEVNYGRIPVTGDIQFFLVYNNKAGQLEVHIKQCKDLAPVDTKHGRSDPYVKTYLLPDRTRGSKRKTKIKKHTLNPAFDEVLKYTISKSELESRQLWVTVWHNDRFGRNDFLGEVMLPLDYYRYDGHPRWYQLQERMEDPEDTSLMSYKGDLYVSIKFVTPDMVEGGGTKKKTGSFRRKSKEKEKVKTGGGEVHVLVREAKNLTAMRGASGGSNPFCKGYLLPDDTHSSKQKTPVLKKTVNPKWSHILIFDGVDQKQLQHHGVELTIWDHEKLSSNDFLGGVRLNLGDGTFHGKPVEWMDARGEEIEVWRSMINHPNEWVDAQLPLRPSMGQSTTKK